MATNDLRLPERAVLLTLMAQAREVSNPELKTLTGVTLTGQARYRLIQRDLVTSRKQGQAYAHELTDKGWKWCADELTASRPARAGSAGGALYAVLGGLHRYLERADLRLADVFGPDGGQLPATAVAGVGTARPAPEPDLEEEIRMAYRELASEPRDWVSLARLRPLLGATARDEVDAALRRLSRARLANLVPQANQKILSRAEREAAVRVGSEDCHLISIETS